MDKETYLKLVEKASKAASAYYDEDTPVMSDYDYDDIMKEIKEYEKEHPNDVSKDSPTQRVAGTTGKSTFAKVTHKVPMLSLQDVFDESEVTAFLKTSNAPAYTVEQKIDGLSMSVTYENGVLTRAETRGDGFVGEDVTENAKHIKGIPEHLSGETDGLEELEIRCEVYLPVDAFLKINAEKEDNGEKLFANPRNAAAGLLRTSDIGAMKDAGLCAFAFNVQRFKSNNPVHKFGVSHITDLSLLREQGINIVYSRLARTNEEILEEIKKVGEQRGNLPYWIDGAVVKIDSIQMRTRLGEAGKYPRWAVAFKYPPEEKETEITDIILQTGRTGRVTPVAIFKPVFLAGTKVEKATLHNPEMIESLGINIGSTVVVRKAAEIIPEVVKAKVRTSDIYNVLAHKCPSCGGDLVQAGDDNGGDLRGAYCMNKSCPAQLARSFEFWGSRDVMDIRGFGPSVIDRFIKEELLTSIPDIYRLRDYRTAIMMMDGFGIKGTDNLLSSIEDSKTRDIDRLIKALGIPGVGKTIGAKLSEEYNDIWAVARLSEDDLVKIDGIGEINASVLYKALHSPETLNMLHELENLGVNTKSLSFKGNVKASVSTENATSNTVNTVSGMKKTANGITGESIVITGVLRFDRATIEDKLSRKYGAFIQSSVNRKTTLLIVGDNPGNTKLTKAKTLGVPMIDENEMWVRLANAK